MNNNYALPSYADFDEEAERMIILSASKRKLLAETREQQLERNIRMRYCVMKYRFMRSSTKHKKEFLLTVIRNIKSLETLAKIVSFIRCHTMKISTHELACNMNFAKEKILVDHDRMLDKKIFEEANEDDISWLKDAVCYVQELLIPKLIALSPSICRLLYADITTIYKEKLREEGLTIESGGTPFQNLKKPIDDTDKYPNITFKTAEVERLRKKQNEIIEKYRHEVETVYNKLHPSMVKKNKTVVEKSSNKPNNKQKETDKKIKEKQSTKTKPVRDGNKSNDLDRIQMLPIWIVKKIFSYIDDKSLANLKKVNAHWKYSCETVLKERKAKKSINETIRKMKAGIDPKYFEEVADFRFNTKSEKRPTPEERKIDQLLARGTIKKGVLHKKCKKSEVLTRSFTEDIANVEDFYFPIQNLTTFPRCVREDLILYKDYFCPLKDVNIILDFGDDTMKKYKETLSYSLSEKLSDTFSLLEADLSGW